MKSFSKIIAVVLVLVTLFSLFSSVAIADDYTWAPSTFWEQLCHLLIDSPDSHFASAFMQQMLFRYADSVCEQSDDGYHHCTGKDLIRIDDVPDLGIFDDVDALCYGKCQYCGESFPVTEEDFKRAYGSPLGHGMGGSTGDDPVVGGFGNRVKEELGTTVVGNNCFYLPPDRASLGGASSYGNVVFDPSNILNAVFSS